MTRDRETILLVEDNDDDVVIFRHAYRQTGLAHALQVVGDGQEAIDYLRGEGRYADRTAFPWPCVVLLDLKLPLHDGFEVLAEIRASAAAPRLCAIVLSSSGEPRDVRRARDLGASAFLVKPPKPKALADAVVALTGRGDCHPGDVAIEGDLLSARSGASRLV